MHIGVDASRATVPRRTGTESYSLHLIRALTALGGEDHFTLYSRDRPSPGLFPDSPQVTSRVIPFPRLWTHARLSWEMASRPPDVLFVPAHSLPVYAPRASVVTVHDLGYLHYPQAHPLGQRLYLNWSTRYSAHRAARVIADSLTTKSDLTRWYGIRPKKISVIYPGRDEALIPVRDAQSLVRVRQKYRLPEHYLLHVGTLQPRKNLLRLVEAFHLLISGSVETQYALRNTDYALPLALVLAGRQGWLAQPVLDQVKALDLESRVRFLDYVAEQDLGALYSGAELYVFPSLYEGFGFTPLEAMACGVPVVCSRASSLPETVGDAALLVDPLDVTALAQAIGAVLMRPELRASLVEQGFRQMEQFSWARCAQETLMVLREAALGASQRE